ncbi:MAG: DUF3662 domain-containing protein [Desulfitobacterium sp.]|nr:DUF3662 domain-containing protein [Desulfitobacterium sp.]
MSLLARFEEVAESLFTGLFKKNSKARLQPVELAKELVRVMLKNKQISISQVYVPNVYRVYLHSRDWGSFASFGDAFLVELSKYLYAEGTKNGFTFLSKPSIELHSDDTVKPREMFIEVDFDDSIEVTWGDEEEEEYNGQNDNFEEELTEFLNLDSSGRRINYILEVILGPDAGKTFPLEEDSYHIGRHSQCEIVVRDPEVSRRHLRVRREGKDWIIDDLGSTNGTFLNGQPITRERISLGDRIKMGQTVLILRHE